MTMSDWIVFLDTVSPLVLSGDSFPKEVMQMWVPLRRALLYYVRYWDGQHTEANWQQARNDLLKYARLAEDNFGMQKLMTMQLHTAVVHLTDMVIAYGPAAFRMEFWVERMMQVLKRITKFRTSCSPELVAVNAWLLQSALTMMAATVPGIDSLYNKIDPKVKKTNPPGRDKHDAQGNALIGKLTPQTDLFEHGMVSPPSVYVCIWYAWLAGEVSELGLY